MSRIQKAALRMDIWNPFGAVARYRRRQPHPLGFDTPQIRLTLAPVGPSNNVRVHYGSHHPASHAHPLTTANQLLGCNPWGRGDSPPKQSLRKSFRDKQRFVAHKSALVGLLIAAPMSKNISRADQLSRCYSAVSWSSFFREKRAEL